MPQVIVNFGTKNWSLKVLNKVRIFSWRACKNGVPTKLQLWLRATVNDVMCPFSKSVPEDVCHALFDCLEIRHTWAQQVPKFSPFTMAGSIAELVQRMQAHGSSEDLEKLFMIVWGFWKLGNQWIFEGKWFIALTLYTDFKATYPMLLR